MSNRIVDQRRNEAGVSTTAQSDLTNQSGPIPDHDLREWNSLPFSMLALLYNKSLLAAITGGQESRERKLRVPPTPQTTSIKIGDIPPSRIPRKIVAQKVLENWRTPPSRSDMHPKGKADLRRYGQPERSERVENMGRIPPRIRCRGQRSL